METILRMILGFIGGIIVDIFNEFFVGGVFKLFALITKFFKSLFGIKSQEIEKDPLKILEKKLLYKNVILIATLNEKLQMGIKGAILEVIDEKNAFVEFYEPNSKQQIEYKDELVFQVEIEKLKIIE